MSNDDFIRRLPKAELHLHIEGTLEPEMMFEFARRNDVALPFPDVEAVKAAYRFTNLQSFLDIYYQGADVLRTTRDFYDLMLAYLQKASSDGVRHAEVFFDPQTHTARGIGFDTFMPGFIQASRDAQVEYGISSALILSFLRHLPSEDAVATIRSAWPWLDEIIAVGLDSSEAGNPPERFAEAYRIARDAGLRAVAHAGEEGPPEYVLGALDILGVERVDHGVRAADDPDLVARLSRDGVPLTMCPLSNVALRVFDRLEDHNLRRLMEAGVTVTINSDDPAYFGGYVGDNYLATAEALDLGTTDLITLARNSIEATFLPPDQKAALLAEFPSPPATRPPHSVTGEGAPDSHT